VGNVRQAHKVLVRGQRFGVAVPRKELVLGNLDSIDPSIDWRRPIIPVTQRFRIFVSKMFHPAFNQELRVRCSNADVLLARCAYKVRFAARGTRKTPLTKDRPLVWPKPPFQNRRAPEFRARTVDKGRAAKIACIVIEMSGAQRIDPEIEQRQVAQDAVEKLRGKSAIRRCEIACSQELPEDCDGELFAPAPFLEGDEREAA
jgi:hypothetical protein